MKNLRANQTGRFRPRGARGAATRKGRPAGALRLLAVLLIIGAAALLPERAVWAGEFKLQTGPGTIQGYGRQVALGEVLSFLAQHNGYVVQIDQALLDVPTTFFIPVPMPAERAIQRIVHPHSLALVFNRVAGKSEPVISQIKVFDKGSQSSSYAMLSGNGTPISHASYGRYNGARSENKGRQRVQAGRAAVDAHVQPPVIFKKSSLGFTGFKFKDSLRGPDYRLNRMTMANSYADYRAERKALNTRVDHATLLAAQRKVEQEKAKYRSGRTASLRQTINDSIK